MACSDLISNVPDIVIDKILDKLPISKAAQTIVLSKQWRHAWLSLKRLIFDFHFWKENKTQDGLPDWQKFRCIISSVLLHHNGPVHEFYLFIPITGSSDLWNLSQWISFLSNNGVRKIVIRNGISILSKKDITSYIFRCSKLVCLELKGFKLNLPPTDFTGFPNLKHLVLENIEFIKESIFSSLIENCRMLETFKLVEWSGMDHIVIDVPSLQILVLNGDFESLAFRNLRSLKSISVCLKTVPKNHATTVATIDAVNILASSCQLQSIEFDGHLSKFLAAGGIIRSPPVTFNHLDELCFSNLNLSDSSVFRYLLYMIECCPCIKKLNISVISGENVGKYITDYNYNKLDHLHEVNIQDITGTSSELKLVEYLLAISPVLENLFFKSGRIGIESELNMSQALLRFPRASTKASLVCLKK